MQYEKLSERMSGTVKAYQLHYVRVSMDRKPILQMENLLMLSKIVCLHRKSGDILLKTNCAENFALHF